MTKHKNTLIYTQIPFNSDGLTANICKHIATGIKEHRKERWIVRNISSAHGLIPTTSYPYPATPRISPCTA